ncbi:MAG: YafY family protein [Amphritea sp.]
MRKSDRLFQLTNILRTHQPITAKKLSELLNVSERTIYRYVDDLSVSGIPVYGEPGIGYRLSEGFELPPLQLTRQELEALILGVNLVSTRTGNELANAARSLLSKIETVVPGKANLNNDEAQRFVMVSDAYYGNENRSQWDSLHSEIKNKHFLKIKYLSLPGVETERIIFPLGLFYWGGKWTLGAWCMTRTDYRDFRVDRIQHIDVLTEKYDLPATVALQNYIDFQKNRKKEMTTDTMLSVVGH